MGCSKQHLVSQYAMSESTIRPYQISSAIEAYFQQFLENFIKTYCTSDFVKNINKTICDNHQGYSIVTIHNNLNAKLNSCLNAAIQPVVTVQQSFKAKSILGKTLPQKAKVMATNTMRLNRLQQAYFASWNCKPFSVPWTTHFIGLPFS